MGLIESETTDAWFVIFWTSLPHLATDANATHALTLITAVRNHLGIGSIMNLCGCDGHK